MIDNKLLTQREHNVVKSNALIQKSRYDLSLQEQKIILRLIQMIEPIDKDLKLYSFKIKDFCEFCGIEFSGNFSYIKSTIKTLSDKSYWITLEDGRETLVRWIEKPYIDKGSGTIEIKLDNDMKPYLLELQNYFTQYSLYYTIAMKSKYSIRLYELLKSYQNLKEKTFDIEKLKHQLMADTYTRWADFKRKVLDISITEINLLSDIYITYELEKNGRQYISINFSIRFKKNVDEKLTTCTEIENRLDKKQIKRQMKLAIDEVMPNE